MAIIGGSVQTARLVLQGELMAPGPSGVRVLDSQDWTALISPDVAGYEKLPANAGLYQVTGEWRKSTRKVPPELARIPGVTRDTYEAVFIHECKIMDKGPQFTNEEAAEAFKDF